MMKLTRTGRLRDAGTNTLVSADLTLAKSASFTLQGDTFKILCNGKDRGNNYTYSLALEPHDIIEILKRVAAARLTDKAEAAIAGGSIECLRVLLAKTESVGK